MGITSVASRRNRRPQRIPTTAQMVSRIGRQVGLSSRRSGAVGSMAKAAQTKVEDASRRLSHTIVMQGLPIGCRAGLLRRRHGVVRTRARGALRQLEDVLERERWVVMTYSTGVIAIFRCHQHDGPREASF